MRLFLSDTFFDAMFDLPKKIQDKVIAFQKKFRENTTTLGIHLEPISQFKNSALRTARVDDNYRVIVGVLDGNNYSLLYVGDHEEAYRWGMNKHFVWNEHTQACQLITIQETEETMTIPAHIPTESAFFAGVPEDKLLKVGIPLEIIPQVMTIRSLDDLDELESILPSDAYENLFNLMDGENIDELVAITEEGQAKADEDQLLSSNNRRRFIELTDDDALQHIIEQGMDKWQIFLHPSQRKLVDADYKGTMKVSGGAGTGKTVAALHSVKNLIQKYCSPLIHVPYVRIWKILSKNWTYLVNDIR